MGNAWATHGQRQQATDDAFVILDFWFWLAGNAKSLLTWARVTWGTTFYNQIYQFSQNTNKKPAS
jgi:hypothetical protein